MHIAFGVVGNALAAPGRERKPLVGHTEGGLYGKSGILIHTTPHIVVDHRDIAILLRNARTKPVLRPVTICDST